MSEKKKIYIAGAGGMLGEAFQKVFSDDFELRCTDKDVNADWLSFLDFRDAAAYRKDVFDFEPDYLFHLGAHTSLEYCEENYEDCYKTNTLAVEDAAHIANELQIPILYISTAGIFDGAQETYDDWDEPRPLGHYARSKYMGERFIAENCRRHLVCRAGWMMGAGPTKDKKFIQKLMAQLKAGKTELMVVDDKLGTPTYTHDFARNVKLLLEHEHWGVYNMVCGGVTGRLEVAQHLVQLLGLEGTVTVTPVSSDYFAKEYFAARPPSERLIAQKLTMRGLNVMRDWRVCLREYLDEYYRGYL
ncbi:MAG: sugar nucleotide-binding protein [Polyangiaceae bacterium]|nr:sugar nucleotide-binding protein [Polyangiaceae bacterium]